MVADTLVGDVNDVSVLDVGALEEGSLEVGAFEAGALFSGPIDFSIPLILFSIVAFPMRISDRALSYNIKCAPISNKCTRRKHFLDKYTTSKHFLDKCTSGNTF